MKKMVIYAVSLITALVLAGCYGSYKHEFECEMDTHIFIPIQREQSGNQDWSQQYNLYRVEYALFDSQTKEKLQHHGHRVYNIPYLDGYQTYYMSPDICDRTFPSVQALMTSYFDEKKEGGKRYVQIDTIDVELHYLDFDKCNITSYSLNGVPQWRRDTCQTDYSRTMRFCNLVVDPERFIEKE